MLRHSLTRTRIEVLTLSPILPSPIHRSTDIDSALRPPCAASLPLDAPPPPNGPPPPPLDAPPTLPSFATYDGRFLLPSPSPFPRSNPFNSSVVFLGIPNILKGLSVYAAGADCKQLGAFLIVNFLHIVSVLINFELIVIMSTLNMTIHNSSRKSEDGIEDIKNIIKDSTKDIKRLSKLVSLMMERNARIFNAKELSAIVILQKVIDDGVLCLKFC